MTSYLIPVVNATSKLEGREWSFDGSRVRWIEWQSREEETPVIGEARQTESGEWEHHSYREGRLVIETEEGRALEHAQRATDALSALLDLVSGPWGFQL